jgi:hypothetical protein
VADRCRLEFAYDFGGMRLTSWNSVYRNMQVQALQVNQEIEILVDAARPDNAIVRQLYV